MSMLCPVRGSVFRIAAAVVTLAGLLGCGTKSEYHLEAEPSSSPTASTESTDGSWRSALGNLILPLIEDHDTEYAQGYSEEVFRSLGLGTDRETVEDLLGSPLFLRNFPNGMTYWYYSRHGKQSENYFVRITVFDAEGNLVERHSDFYLD